MRTHFASLFRQVRRIAPPPPAGSPPPGPPPPAGALPNFTISHTSTVSNHPYSFGQAFPKGNVPAGVELETDVGSFQINPISFWDDGSVKHAHVAGKTNVSTTPVVIDLVEGSDPTGTNLNESNLSGVAATIQYGAAGTLDIQNLIGTGALKKTWYQGPQYCFFQYIAAFPSDSDLRAAFYVELWQGGAYRVQIAVEFGNMQSGAPTLTTSKTGTCTVNIAGSTVYNSNVTTNRGRRFVFEGGSFTPATLLHNNTYLKSTKLVPNLAASAPSSTTLNNLDTTYNPLDLMGWTNDQGGGAWHPDIGILTHWDACYVTSNDVRAKNAVIAQDKGYGTYSIFFRDSSTLRFPEPSDWATAWTTDEDFNAWNDGAGPGYRWEVHHHPNAGYLAWLITGHLFHLETMQANALACYWSNANSPTLAGANAAWKDATRVVDQQTRGRAWRLRSYGVLAALSPDGDPIAADYKALVAASINYFKVTNVDTNTPATGLYGILDDKEGGISGFQHSMFESAFLIQTVAFLWDIEMHLSTQQKMELERVRDFGYRAIVGLFGRGQTYGEYNWRQAPGPYRTTIGSSNTIASLYNTWGEIQQATWNDGLDGSDGLTPRTDAQGVTGYYNDASSDAFPTGNWLHMLAALVPAVEHGFYGAAACHERITGATDWATNVAKCSEWPQYYTAPRALSLPYSLPAAGTAVSIGTNTALSVKPANITNFNFGYSTFNGYGCGFFIKDYSVTGAFVISSNGSHGAPSYPDAVLFDFDDATWKRVDNSLGAPARDTDYVDAELSGSPWWEINGFGVTPAGSHLYHTAQILDRKYGGGPKGSFMKMGQWALTEGVATYGGGIHSIDLSNGVWQRVNGQSGIIFGSGDQVEGMTAQDIYTGRWWFQPFAPHINNAAQYLDPVDLTLKTVNTVTFPPDDTSGSNYGVLFVDQRFRLLIAHRANTDMVAMELDNPASGWHRLSEQGTRPSEVNRIHYYPKTGAYYTKQKNSGNTITKLLPPTSNPLTADWTWSTVTVTGATLPNYTTTGGTDKKHYTCCFYIPRLDCFGWIAGESANMILFKPGS